MCGAAGAELGFIDTVEAFDAGFGEEAFESADASSGEGFDIGRVVIGDSTRGCPVDFQALTFSGGTFCFEGGNVCESREDS